MLRNGASTGFETELSESLNVLERRSSKTLPELTRQKTILSEKLSDGKRQIRVGRPRTEEEGQDAKPDRSSRPQARTP
jgi:hypothetical protein